MDCSYVDFLTSRESRQPVYSIREQHVHLRRVLEDAFREDIGYGDLSASLLRGSDTKKGFFATKQDGVLAGMDVICEGYRLMSPDIEVQLHESDGSSVSAGDLLATVTGPAEQLLSGERVILNILQHLSGIATATAVAVKALEGSGIRICDTRKTLPGLRAFQKYAVRCGGGYNHRFGLDGGVMIKDNHIVAAGGIVPAVEAARRRVGLMVKIEVECETRNQVIEAVESGADIIMLDNMGPGEVKVLRKEIPEGVLVELSGGITPEQAVAYRDCGADYISMGSLTHSVRAMDISFNIEGGAKAGPVLPHNS